MSFRFVPNSVTFADLERLNGPNRRVISPNSVAHLRRPNLTFPVFKQKLKKYLFGFACS